MSKYRIIEKKGHYEYITYCDSEKKDEPHIHNSETNKCGQLYKKYIHHFYVEVYIKRFFKKSYWALIEIFNTLEEARAYKRELALEEGIVIE